MTAQEKFDARLKELGLEKEFGIDMHVGTVLPDGRVVVLVHYPYEEEDPYTEIEFPPYEELWKNEKFREECKKEFYADCDGNDEFIAKLAQWLDLHRPTDKCPLFPVDLYWLPGGFETKWFNYEDDQTAEEIIKNLVKEHSVA